MNVPFTVEQFLQVIKEYNISVWPMQVIFYLLGIMIIYFIVRKTEFSDRLINYILALFWVWIGIAYHLAFFTSINKAAYVFGFLTIIQGIIFIFLGVSNKRFSYAFHPDIYGWTGLLFIIYALAVYPVIGHFSNHSYPYAPTFGLPCPTTIFTFGILLFATKRIPIWALIIPLLWTIVGTSAAFKFDIWEDIGLIISGVVAFLLIIYRNRKTYPIEKF